MAATPIGSKAGGETAPPMPPAPVRGRYERRIKAAKRAARSELSVTKGEWRVAWGGGWRAAPGGVQRPRHRRHRRHRRHHHPRRPPALLPPFARSKHGYASSDLLSVADIVDDVPRVRLAVRATRRAGGQVADPPRPTHLHGPSPPPPFLQDLEPGEFAARFERPRLPVVITDAADTWPAGGGAWATDALLARVGSHKFKVGADDDGCSVRLRFKDFAAYCTDGVHAGADDSPLYIFDGSFADKEGSKCMAADYAVPPPFEEDLMALAGERRRPPYRCGAGRGGGGGARQEPAFIRPFKELTLRP